MKETYIPTDNERIFYILKELFIYFSVGIILIRYLPLWFICPILFFTVYNALKLKKEDLYLLDLNGTNLSVSKRGFKILGFGTLNTREKIDIPFSYKTLFQFSYNGYILSDYCLTVSTPENKSFQIKYIFIRSLKKTYNEIQKIMIDNFSLEVIQKITQENQEIDFGRIKLSKSLIYINGVGYKWIDFKGIETYRKEKNTAMFTFITSKETVFVEEVWNSLFCFHLIKEINSTITRCGN